MTAKLPSAEATASKPWNLTPKAFVTLGDSFSVGEGLAKTAPNCIAPNAVNCCQLASETLPMLVGKVSTALLQGSKSSTCSEDLSAAPNAMTYMASTFSVFFKQVLDANEPAPIPHRFSHPGIFEMRCTGSPSECKHQKLLVANETFILEQWD